MPKPPSSRVPAAQLPLPFFAPAVVLPQGDGSYVVRPGKPVELLTVRQFAAAVGLSPKTIYDYVGTRWLPDEFVVIAGKRRIKIKAGAIPVFLAEGKRVRDGLPEGA